MAIKKGLFSGGSKPVGSRFPVALLLFFFAFITFFFLFVGSALFAAASSGQFIDFYLFFIFISRVLSWFLEIEIFGICVWENRVLGMNFVEFNSRVGIFLNLCKFFFFFCLTSISSSI